MSHRLEDHVDEYLPIRVAQADGRKTREKIIYPIVEADPTEYHLLGTASAVSVGLAIHEAFMHVPDFYRRVRAYRLVHGLDAEILTEATGTAYVSIEFYEQPD